VFSLAGSIAVVSSLQVVYERIFALEPLGRRNLPRCLAWIAVLFVVLVLDGALRSPIRRATGEAVVDLVGVAMTGLFLWWTMHFLLAGRVAWRRLLRPAVTTGLLWLFLTVFSSVYFSPTLISDSHTYGTIGVIFSLLTWFFLIGAAIVLGAVLGAAWQARAERDAA
jgi:membrane protein